MPSFIFSSSVAAGATYRPLDGWQYVYLPWPAEVTVLARATAVDMVNVYTSGSETTVSQPERSRDHSRRDHRSPTVVVTTEIQQNRYDQTLRRVGGLVGPGSKVSEVLAELFPMFDVENVPAELQILGGTALAWRGTDITAAAGLVNASQLENPPGSAKLITVTKLIISVDMVAKLVLTTAAAQLANTNGLGQFLDPRAAGPGGGSAVGNTRIETGLTVNPGITIRLLSNTTITIEEPKGIVVLPPDSRLTIGTSAAQARMMVAYFWRERVAERSELDL